MVRLFFILKKKIPEKDRNVIRVKFFYYFLETSKHDRKMIEKSVFVSSYQIAEKRKSR